MHFRKQQNKREERETHAKLITDRCPRQRVQAPPITHASSASFSPVTSVATQLLLCCSQSKRCSKTIHAVKIATFPRQSHDVNTQLWCVSRARALWVSCVFTLSLVGRQGHPVPWLPWRALILVPGCSMQAASRQPGCHMLRLLHPQYGPVATGSTLVIMGAHWSSQQIFTSLGLSWRQRQQSHYNLIKPTCLRVEKRKKILLKVQLPLGLDANSLGSDLEATM